MESANLGNIKATAVILGGTGDVGTHISKAFLTDFRSAFPSVRITTRDPDSPRARELAKLGADVRSPSEPIEDVFSGADVVIDALPAQLAGDYRERVLKALVRENVKLFFLSEYGIDYHVADFKGYEHPEWVTKRKVAAATHTALQGKVKVVELVTGLFHSWVFHPELGIDVKKNTYKPLGPGTLRFATTSKRDIGRSIARLSIIALDPATAAAVPGRLRVAGHNVSYDEIRDIVARVRGVPKGTIQSADLKAAKEHLSKHPTDNILDYIIIVVGEGKADYSDNLNGLVNPGQRFWEWRSVEEELRSPE